MSKKQPHNFENATPWLPPFENVSSHGQIDRGTKYPIAKKSTNEMLVPRVNYFFRRRPLNVGPSRISELMIPEAIKPPETKTKTNHDEVSVPTTAPAITAAQMAFSLSF